MIFFILLVIFTLGLLGVCVFRRQYSAFLQISFLPNENLIRPLKGAMGVKMKDQSLHAFPLYLIPKAQNIYFYTMCCADVASYNSMMEKQNFKLYTTDIFKLVSTRSTDHQKIVKK